MVIGVGISDAEEGGSVVVRVVVSDMRGAVFSSGLGVGVETGGSTVSWAIAATGTFLRRRRLLAGKGSLGAEYHGSFINLSAI